MKRKLLAQESYFLFTKFEQFAILVVKKFNGDFNKEVVNISITVNNDGIHDSMLDIWWEQYVVIQNFFISVRVSAPENDHDVKYQREMFRGTFDGARLIKQGYSSAMGRFMLESLFSFIDFELKMPFQKVFNWIIWQLCLLFFDFSRGCTE